MWHIGNPPGSCSGEQREPVFLLAGFVTVFGTNQHVMGDISEYGGFKYIKVGW
jgi:hypothetical protein